MPVIFCELAVIWLQRRVLRITAKSQGGGRILDPRCDLAEAASRVTAKVTENSQPNEGQFIEARGPGRILAPGCDLAVEANSQIPAKAQPSHGQITAESQMVKESQQNRRPESQPNRRITIPQILELASIGSLSSLVQRLLPQGSQRVHDCWHRAGLRASRCGLKHFHQSNLVVDPRKGCSMASL